MYLNLFCAW